MLQERREDIVRNREKTFEGILYEDFRNRLEVESLKEIIKRKVFHGLEDGENQNV